MKHVSSYGKASPLWHADISIEDLEARVVRAQRNNFEQAAIQSANNDTTEDPPPGCISRNCGKIALGIISVILVAALLKLFHVYSGGTDLGYVAHPPGNKPEDPEDDPNDKEIVEQFNVAAKAYGVDISSPFTKAQVKPLLKEAYDWFWMSEEAFWKTFVSPGDLYSLTSNTPPDD